MDSSDNGSYGDQKEISVNKKRLSQAVNIVKYLFSIHNKRNSQVTHIPFCENHKSSRFWYFYLLYKS